MKNFLPHSVFRNSAKVLFLALSVAIIFYACKKDRGQQLQQTAIGVADLQNWYQSNQSNFGKSTKLFTDLKPDFQTAYSAIQDGYQVTEFNPTISNQLALISGPADQAKIDKVTANTLTKFILFNSVGTKNVGGAYMVLSGNGTQNLQNVHYKNYSGFTGQVNFFNIDGTFENAYVINDGKIKRTVKKSAQTENLQKIKDGLAEKISKDGTKKGERVMLAHVDEECTRSFVNVYQTQCFQFDVEPVSVKSKQEKLSNAPVRHMTASQNYCHTEILTVVVETCQSTGGGWGEGGGYPNISGGGNGNGTGSGIGDNVPELDEIDDSDVPDGPKAESDYRYTCPDNFGFADVTVNNLWQEAEITDIYCNLGIYDFMSGTISNSKTVKIPAASFGLPHFNIEGKLVYTKNEAKAISADALNMAEEDMRKKYKANPYLTSGQLADYWMTRMNIRMKEITTSKGRVGRTGSINPDEKPPSKKYNPC